MGQNNEKLKANSWCDTFDIRAQTEQVNIYPCTNPPLLDNNNNNNNNNIDSIQEPIFDSLLEKYLLHERQTKIILESKSETYDSPNYNWISPKIKQFVGYYKNEVINLPLQPECIDEKTKLLETINRYNITKAIILPGSSQTIKLYMINVMDFLQKQGLQVTLLDQEMWKSISYRPISGD
jgi:hypothetical protein